MLCQEFHKDDGRDTQKLRDHYPNCYFPIMNSLHRQMFQSTTKFYESFSISSIVHDIAIVEISKGRQHQKKFYLMQEKSQHQLQSYNTAWVYNRLHPYHVYYVEALQIADFPSFFEFARLLQQRRQKRDFRHICYLRVKQRLPIGCDRCL